MKLRASLSRLRRDFWGYTQSVENLQLHLWLFIALHNGYELPVKKVCELPKKEPETPKREKTKLDLPDLSKLPQETCSFYRNSVVMIGVAFQKAHRLLGKNFYLTQFDSERRVLSLTFFESQVPGASKVPRVENSAYISIGAILRREGLVPEKGKVPIYWDEEHESAFVQLETVLSKREGA